MLLSRCVASEAKRANSSGNLSRRKKEELQKWVETIPFSHRIDIQPYPSHPVSQDELCQRMRKILFDINKKYLRSRSFPKWRPEDKFWIMGVREGDYYGISHHHHFHLLLHSPKGLVVDVWGDLHWGWMKCPYVNPVSGRPRRMISFRKDRFHVGDEELIEVLPLYIERVNSVSASTRYNSKKINGIDLDNLFFVGISE
jgi:hypothetical protein